MLVARATFLSERLQGSVDFAAGARPSALSEARLAQWRLAVEPSGTDWLQKRLRWEGLDAQRVHTVLSDDLAELHRPLPEWATTLKQVLQRARDEHSHVWPAPSPMDPNEPIPFEDVMGPAVMVARDMLCDELGLHAHALRFPLLGLIGRDAYRALERGLLKQLSVLAGPTLQSEFVASQPYGKALLLMLGMAADEPTGDAHYRTFVREQNRSGWSLLMDQYPVLGRLIATAIQLWVKATASLCQRLTADYHQLVDTFELGVHAEQISGFELSLSDRHRGGRVVLVIEFTGGQKLVYKPKPLRLEVAFNHLLAWCNARGAFPEMRTLTILDRGDYGWVEYVKHVACTDECAAHRFYRRAGMLLCLAHITRATDCHYENLIADGEFPVLVDAETLLYPEPQPLDGSWDSMPGEFSAEQTLAESVLRTGLLPRWEARPEDDSAHDISALGCVAGQPASRRILRWHRINTDQMFTRYEEGVIEARQNVARLAGRTLAPIEFEKEVIQGFSDMYRLVIAHRDALRDPDGPLRSVRGVGMRFIYRPTRIYSALMRASWIPEMLRSGIEFGLHFEQLARAFLVAENKPSTWPVFCAEVRALEQLDVPLFTTSANGTALQLDTGLLVTDAFHRIGYDAMLELIASMSEALLARQTAIIQGALRANGAQTPSGDVVDIGLTWAAATTTGHSYDPVEEATKIGRDVERDALADGDGVNWIGSRYIPRADRFQLAAMNDSLYDGSSGVALFLAALSRVTGEERFGMLARRSLKPVRRRLLSTRPAQRGVAARALGLGGAVGLGSIIYSLVRTAAFLGRGGSELIEDATSLADWFSTDVISADANFDVMSGAAGGMLGLLSLHAATGVAAILEKAVWCGDHLLLCRVESQSGHKTWTTVADVPLTGFSHGAAGIAYALVRLYGATRHRAYLDAAVEAIEFERSVFSPQRGNWPDFRRRRADGTVPFPNKWCHGAAGITLARLGCQQIADINGIDREIDIGLRTTHERYLQEADYVCCGNFGRAETLLMGASVTNAPEWRHRAAVGISAIVARATTSGHYALSTGVGVPNPGFFQGTAGIGYELLRVADASLPCVLLWH